MRWCWRSNWDSTLSESQVCSHKSQGWRRSLPRTSEGPNSRSCRCWGSISECCCRVFADGTRSCRSWNSTLGCLDRVRREDTWGRTRSWYRRTRCFLRSCWQSTCTSSRICRKWGLARGREGSTSACTRSCRSCHSSRTPRCTDPARSIGSRRWGSLSRLWAGGSFCSCSRRRTRTCRCPCCSRRLLRFGTGSSQFCLGSGSRSWPPERESSGCRPPL